MADHEYVEEAGFAAAFLVSEILSGGIGSPSPRKDIGHQSGSEDGVGVELASTISSAGIGSPARSMEVERQSGSEEGVVVEVVTEIPPGKSQAREDVVEPRGEIASQGGCGGGGAVEDLSGTGCQSPCDLGAVGEVDSADETLSSVSASGALDDGGGCEDPGGSVKRGEG